MMLDRNGYRKWNAYRKQLAAGVKEVGQRLAPIPPRHSRGSSIDQHA